MRQRRDNRGNCAKRIFSGPAGRPIGAADLPAACVPARIVTYNGLRGVNLARTSVPIPSDLQRLMYVLYCDSEIDALVVDVMINSGLRVSDALSLPAEAAYKPVIVREHKTGVVRAVDLPERLQGRLRAFLAGRRDGMLFRGARGAAHRSRATVWRHLVAAWEAAGLTGRAPTPHSMRRLYARRLMAAGLTAEDIRSILHHQHLSTTLLYLYAD